MIYIPIDVINLANLRQVSSTVYIFPSVGRPQVVPGIDARNNIIFYVCMYQTGKEIYVPIARYIPPRKYPVLFYG